MKPRPRPSRTDRMLDEIKDEIDRMHDEIRQSKRRAEAARELIDYIELHFEPARAS